MKQIVISFHIAIGKIYRTIAELNVRIGYLPIFSVYTYRMHTLRKWDFMIIRTLDVCIYIYIFMYYVYIYTIHTNCIWGLLRVYVTVFHTRSYGNIPFLSLCRWHHKGWALPFLDFVSFNTVQSNPNFLIS